MPMFSISRCSSRAWHVAAFTMLMVGCNSNRGINSNLQTETMSLQSDREANAAVTPELARITSQASFEPRLDLPHPDRVNPFAAFPGPTLTSSSRTAETESTGMLFGFVDVGDSAAVLRIDEQLHVLREGEQEGDVRVLRIDPPEVEIEIRGHKQSLRLP